MNEFFENSLFAGVALSLISYMIGTMLKKKLKLGLFNPLLISIVISIIVLWIGKIDYETYHESAKYLSWLLTPATVCLAIPLYEQWELLKQNYKAVFCGLLAGTVTSLTTVFVLAKLCELSHEEYVTLLPKSITTAIGMGVSEELGGYVTITVAVIIITGILGNMFGELICKLFKITEPISKGLAFGASAHAIGTAKAIEMGEIEGAMSGLAIAVSGILTVAFAPVFANFISGVYHDFVSVNVQSLTETKPLADCRNAQMKQSAKQTRIPQQERRGVLEIASAVSAVASI